MRRCYSGPMTTPAHSNIENAARIIREGGLVAMPTETVYGLAADATNDAAVARIFDAKGRPQFNPLIIHVAGADMAKRHVDLSPLAAKLIAAFWPGPLTLVLPRRKDSGVSLLVSAGLDTLGVRMPNHPLAQALISAVDRPLAAPSANRSGTISPTRAEHVKDSLGDKVDMILDGGASPIGVESTIVKVDGDRVVMLRPGGIARADIERVTGAKLENAAGGIEAPGMMASHYAPDASMRLNARDQKDGEAFLGFGDVKGIGPAALNLSASGDLVEAAANLFAHLRALDRMAGAAGLKVIACAPVPMEGLGEAINDRLARAAAPK